LAACADIRIDVSEDPKNAFSKLLPCRATPISHPPAKSDLGFGFIHFVLRDTGPTSVAKNKPRQFVEVVFHSDLR
jgi:hypothetical protein